MSYQKPLRKLGHKDFVEDIKKFIKNSHEFYRDKVPEMKVLAKRLHEEQDLKNFYRIFNRLWKSGYQNEKSLAIHTLQLYKNDFDLVTLDFLKVLIQNTKNYDDADSFAQIIGDIALKFPSAKRDIFINSGSENPFVRKVFLLSCIRLLEKKDLDYNRLVVRILKDRIYDPNYDVRFAAARVIKEMSRTDKEAAKKFVLKNTKMSDSVFIQATENMKDLRKIKEIKKLSSNNDMFF